MIRGFAILLFLQLVGELLVHLGHWPLPGSVVGMILLLIFLRFGWISLRWVNDASELLLQNLSLLFVPAGVGVMVHFSLISEQWLPLAAAIIVSTFAVLLVTGWTAQALTKPAQRASQQESQPSGPTS